MSAEIRERLAALEAAAKEIPELRKEVEALKRFKIAATTLWAATLGIVGFFAEKIRKAMGL